MITVYLGILRLTVQDSKQLKLRDAMNYLVWFQGDRMAMHRPEPLSRKSRSRYPTIVALSLLGLLFYSSLSLLQWVRSAPRKALESVWSTEERNGSSEEFGIISVGQAGTTSYELECCTHVLGSSSGCQPISFWHDVPLYVGEDEEGLIRMVVEIPRFTRAKMEINRESYKYPAMNPIRQDLFKDGSLREYPGAIYWNYGAAPQTFEDPSVEEEPGLYGDGDPLDLIEVGRPAVRYRTGQIINVKILGAIGLVDGGEADWKIIVISTDDPLFEQINDITELEASYPNTVSGIREWFRWYKYPSHGVINSFMHGGQPLNRRKAISLVARTHAMWKRRFSPDPELSEV